MIQSGADVNATDNDNETPLFWAHWCDADVIKAFIDAGADVNAKNNLGETAFTRIIQYGATSDVFNILINAGADINAINNNGRTPFFMLLGTVKQLKLLKLCLNSAQTSIPEITMEIHPCLWRRMEIKILKL